MRASETLRLQAALQRAGVPSLVRTGSGTSLHTLQDSQAAASGQDASTAVCGTALGARLQSVRDSCDSRHDAGSRVSSAPASPRAGMVPSDAMRKLPTELLDECVSPPPVSSPPSVVRPCAWALPYARYAVLVR